MFKSLEYFYKTESTRIKFRKSFTKTYFLLSTLILTINGFIPNNILIKTILLMLSFALIIILSIEIASFKTSRKIITNKKELAHILQRYASKDQALIRQYLIKHNYSNNKALKTIANHYLTKSQKPNSTETLLTILLAIASIFTSSLNSEAFSTTKFIISIIIMAFFLLIYYIIKSSHDITLFYTGNDDLNETLEDIITKLYLETIHKNNTK